MNIKLVLACFILLVLYACNKGDLMDANESEVLWIRIDVISDKNFDVVFIHPTTLSNKDSCFNDDLLDNDVNAMSQKSVERQASVFSDSCRIFAPYYRQMSMACLGADDPDSFFQIAYSDVENAINTYIEEYNNDRPFFLVAHSQGSQMLKTFLYNHPDIVNDNLVAVYAVGYTITQDTLDVIGLELSSDSCSIPVLMTWNTIGEGGNSPVLNDGALCVNPLTWKSTTEEASASQNIAAHIYSSTGVDRYPHFCTTQVTDSGALVVRSIDAQVLDGLNMTMGAGVFHMYDYDFFYENIKNNLACRCKTFNQEGLNKENRTSDHHSR